MTSSRGSAAVDVPLKLRPTGLGSGIDKDRPDYTVYCGGWAIGRIYETRGGPDNLRIISRSLFLSAEALGAIALARCPGGLPRRLAGPGGLRLIRVTVTGDSA